jgi:hypothetical protein
MVDIRDLLTRLDITGKSQSLAAVPSEIQQERRMVDSIDVPQRLCLIGHCRARA